MNNTKTKKAASAFKKTATPTLRFAHPFFTPKTPVNRPQVPGVGQRMTDHIQGTLSAIPPVKRNGLMGLDELIGSDGAKSIESANQITIHIAGDTGVPETDHETRQVMVTDEMAKDYDAARPDISPAFFLHLGDVIYGSNPTAYLDQFYRPYMHYPGKIVAIPGNHDGETSEKLAAFQKYFCAASATIPPMANSIYRQTVTQPGVYWCLDAPFVQIIGLYSNSAENPGFIAGPKIGQQQKNWLIQTLKSIKAARDKGTRKALLFATHHPPYSSGGHSGSPDMLRDIDQACNEAGILPDAHLSGHAHSIQRYSRTITMNGKTVTIPYIISGCGGHGGQKVNQPNPQTNGANPVYEFGYDGWGYSKAVITPNTMTITSYGVADHDNTKKVDSVTVALH